MKTYYILLFLIFGFFSLQANEGHYSLYASLVGMSIDYREHDCNCDILDSEKSDFTQIVGVDLGFSYIDHLEGGDFNMADVSLFFTSGETKYVGAYLDSNGSYGDVVSTTLNNISNFDVTYLYGLSLSEHLHLLFGGTLGYRAWERALSQTQVENYSWPYIEPKEGLEYRYDAFSFNTLFGYKYAINPIMTATGISDKFKLGSVESFNLSLKLAYEIEENIELFGEYVYENQVIGKSNVVYAANIQKPVLEPDSISNDNYIKFGAAFKY